MRGVSVLALNEPSNGYKSKPKAAPKPPKMGASLAIIMLASNLVLALTLASQPASSDEPTAVLVQTRHALFRGLLMTSTSDETPGGVAAFLGKYSPYKLHLFNVSPKVALASQ